METKQKPKVAIVDDHEFFRKGLIIALKRINFIKFIYEASNGRDFIDKQEAEPADIVLMDVRMPELDGYKTLIECKKRFPDLKIIILTMFEDDECIRKFIEAGAQGYILKNIDQNGLKAAIKSVIEGKQYFSNELMTFFLRQFNDKKVQENKSHELTRRELEILRLIFEGFSNNEIAEKLHISIRTVTNHRANLKQKTNSKNTACLISYGIRNKLFNL